MADSYIFGGYTGETPQSLQRKRDLLAQMLQGGSQRAPQNVGEGINSFATSLADAFKTRSLQAQIDAGQKAGAASADSKFDGLDLPGFGAPAAQAPPSGQPQTQDANAPPPSPTAPSLALDQGGGAVGMKPYQDAIAKIESGGNYGIRGPVTSRGDRAYGKYQVMGANIPQWTQAALGRVLSPQEFLDNPQAQDAVFNHRFGGYLKNNSPSDAASMWFTGRPLAQGGNARDQLGTSGNRYAQMFSAGLPGGNEQPAQRALNMQIVAPDGSPVADPSSIDPPVTINGKQWTRASAGATEAPDSPEVADVAAMQANLGTGGGPVPMRAVVPANAAGGAAQPQLAQAAPQAPAPVQAQPAPAPVPMRKASPQEILRAMVDPFQPPARVQYMQAELDRIRSLNDPATQLKLASDNLAYQKNQRDFSGQGYNLDMQGKQIANKKAQQELDATKMERLQAPDGTVFEREAGTTNPWKPTLTLPQKPPEPTSEIKNFDYGQKNPDFLTYIDRHGDKARVLHKGDILARGKDILARNDAGGGADPDTINSLAVRVLNGEPGVLTGLGRGAQGSENLMAVQKRVSELAKERAGQPPANDPESAILRNKLGAAGDLAGSRRLGTLNASMDAFGNEATAMLDLGIEASRNVPRTHYTPVNRAVNFFNEQSGDPATATFATQNNGIINSYARAINFGGSTVSDKDHARAVLSGADSPESYEARVNQLKREISVAQRAGRLARDNHVAGRPSDNFNVPPPSTAPGATSTGVLGTIGNMLGITHANPGAVPMRAVKSPPAPAGSKEYTFNPATGLLE